MKSPFPFSGAGAGGPHTDESRRAPHAVGRDDAPCERIQLDLSAMIDGELDPSAVRRVLVHADACPACRGFLNGIRGQLRAHRAIAGVEPRADGAEWDDGWGDVPDRTHQIRDRLLHNRRQMARILYTLGRSHVLMGTSPAFTREVAEEPVPIPDVEQRGRALLAELECYGPEVEWVPAKELFASHGERSASDNLARGMRLLREALQLDADLHEARIYLGHALHIFGERDEARDEFARVLRHASDALVIGFATINLGNVFLEEGDVAASIPYFERVVELGLVAAEPRFFTAYFNLALAHGLLARFDSAERWFHRLYDEFPHKRRLVGIEIGKRRLLGAAIDRRAGQRQRWAAAFPEWFSVAGEVQQ